MKPRKFPWKWLLLGLALLILAGAILLPRQIGSSPDLRDRVAAALSQWSGATITLTEPLSVRYFPPLSITSGFVLTDAAKMPAIHSISAKDVKISLNPAALLMGRIEVEALRLEGPKITLSSEAPPPGSEAPEMLIAAALSETPVGVVRVRDGTIETAGGDTVASEVDVRIDARDGGGAVAAMGSFSYRGETVRFSLDSGAITGAEGAQSAPFRLGITSDPATAQFSGTVQLADGLAFDGDTQVHMPNARRFLKWVGVPLPDGESLQDLTVSGTAHLAGSTLTFDDGAYSLDGNEAVGLLSVTTGARPRVEGTLAFERLILDPYLGPAGGKTEGVFDWALLKYIDADLRISAGEIVATTLTTGPGGFTVGARNGAVSGEVGELALCGGDVSGRVALDLSNPRAEMSFVGNLTDIVMETCLAPLALDVPLKGVGTAKVDISTGGTSEDALLRGLTGDFKLTALNGAVPIDIFQLMAGTAAKDGSWSHDAVTTFDSLNADCRLSAGHVWCQEFEMKTPRGLVSGSGSVDVAKQKLDWDLVIANPVAQLDASQLVMEAQPRVTIRGPLTEPKIQRATHPTLGDGAAH